MEALQSKVKAFARLAARVKASCLPSAQPVFKPDCDTRDHCHGSLTHVAAPLNWSAAFKSPVVSAAIAGNRDGVGACIFWKQVASRDDCLWIG